MFQGNLGAMVDCDTLNAIESNVKEMKTIMKKLQKSGFGEDDDIPKHSYVCA